MLDEVLDKLLPTLPAFVGVMFGAFQFPYMGKKGMSLTQASRAGGLAGGLICLIGYILFSVLNFEFSPMKIGENFWAIIFLSIVVGISTGFIAFISIDKDKI